MKREVNNICKMKARKLIEDQVQPIKRKLQQGSFQSIDEVQDELNRFKEEFEGPQFKGRDGLI